MGTKKAIREALEWAKTEKVKGSTYTWVCADWAYRAECARIIQELLAENAQLKAELK